MDWACSRFAAPTPRNSCRASFRPMSKSSASGASHARGPAQPAGTRHRLARAGAHRCRRILRRAAARARRARRATPAQVRAATPRCASKTSRTSAACSAARRGAAHRASPVSPGARAACCWRRGIASANSASPMRQRWRAGRCADIAEGLPQVYAATSEAFVAQMLNLDLLGAIAFDKGCYTGQEVDRARPLPRPGEAPPAALASTASGISLEPGGCRARRRRARARPWCASRRDRTGSRKLLAVGNFAAAIEPAAEAAAGRRSRERATVSGPLPLPYSLPE